MSGIEVAGLVLGAFPLAIAALDKYREVARRLGLWNKIRLEHKKCRDQLLFHRLTLTTHLRQLLLPLVVDDARIDKLLLHPGGDDWKDGSIASLLEKRLRDSYQLYLDYVQGMEHVMDEINRELAADSDLIQDRVTSAEGPFSKSRVKQSMTSESRAFQLYRVKFSNGEAARNGLFSELEDYNKKLEKLLDSSDKDAQLVQQRAANAHVAAINSAMSSFWLTAARLFRALASAWSCRCQENHRGKLQLQHRTAKRPEFHIIFELSASSQWRARRTRIAEAPNAEAAERVKATQIGDVPTHQPKHRQNAPVKSAMRKKDANPQAVQLSEHLLVKTAKMELGSGQSGPEKRESSRIADLCATLGAPESSCYGYVDEEDCRYYVYQSPEADDGKFSTVTLEQILCGEIRPRPTRRQRYALSLILSSSVVQLLDTPWLPDHLKKSDIVFLADSEQPGVYRLDQPHVSRDFAGSVRENAKQGTAAGAGFSWSLDQLGIVLLELCFGEALEEQPCRKRWPAGDDEIGRAGFDVMAARDWQYYVNDEAGPEYSEAVGWCLGGNRSIPPDMWREEMLRRVVLPLQRCRDYLNSGGQPAG